jgi:hypothetical protein
MSYQRGESRPSARLTEAQVIAIRAEHGAGATLKTLSEHYPQCSKVNLHHIITGKRWRYLLARTTEGAVA